MPWLTGPMNSSGNGLALTCVGGCVLVSHIVKKRNTGNGSICTGVYFASVFILGHLPRKSPSQSLYTIKSFTMKNMFKIVSMFHFDNKNQNLIRGLPFFVCRADISNL